LDPNHNGPEKYKPFVKSIYEFFKKVDEDYSGQIKVYDPTDIRRELFKLHYNSNRFGLYGKADTPEVIDQILDALHFWIGDKDEC